MNRKLELIRILQNENMSDADRDDAAIDLGYFSGDELVELTLINVANDEMTDEMIRASCGESLAQIWIANNKIDGGKIVMLKEGIALSEAIGFIKQNNIHLYMELEQELLNNKQNRESC